MVVVMAATGTRYNTVYSFYLQTNANNSLITYIYHLLSPTCFGVCYVIFMETITLLAQELYALCSAVTYNVHPVV